MPSLGVKVHTGASANCARLAAHVNWDLAPAPLTAAALARRAVRGPMATRLVRYCKRLQNPKFWGGEAELLVLAKMLKAAIKVYIRNPQARALPAHPPMPSPRCVAAGARRGCPSAAGSTGAT
jgi:hypothetical protein